MEEKGFYTREILYLYYIDGTPVVTDDLDLALRYNNGIAPKTVEYKTREPYTEKCLATPVFN